MIVIIYTELEANPARKNKMQFFFKQRSYEYYYMDAPHGRWLSVWSKSLTAIAQECYELY